MAELKPAIQRMEEISGKVADFLNDDAKKLYEKGTPEHPFIHAQALLVNAAALIEMALDEGIELGDTEGVAQIKEQAEAFEAGMLQVAGLASQMQGLPSVAVIMGMLGAVTELLGDFFEGLDELMKEEGVTPEETPATTVDDLLRGILNNG